MYERKANIEEENLDWSEDLKKVDNETEETRHTIHPDIEHNKIVFHEKVKLSQVNIKRMILNILDDYSSVSLLIGILMLPYIIGFFVISFILLSGGVPIDSFFSLKEEIFHFELWSIGSYIFITVGVIWLVILLFLQKR